MADNQEANNKTHVKKQTLVYGVILSLCIGFFSGILYSSFRLAPRHQAGVQGQPAMEKGMPVENQDFSMAFSERILKLEQYLKDNPGDAEAWANLGHLFFDSDQVQSAIDAYERSLVIEPDKTEVITDLGTMYRRNNQPEKAIETYEKAIIIDPSFENARFNKGVVLLHDLNDLDGCIREWEALVSINPLAMAPNGESVDAIIQRMKTRKPSPDHEQKP